MPSDVQTNDRYVVYDLDGRGRVTEVSDRKQYFKVKAFYDENDREVKRILGNGNKQDYTYDEAGHLLGIVETGSNSAIIRAECYGYDGEGRRIFTADEKGNLTRYVYDEQYRIKEVQYPASEELRAYHREEAKEARLFIDEGAASHSREIMNPVELAHISATFSRLVGARTSNLGSMVGSIQLVWTEQYTYDANGNIATKTTPYGTIHYSYDKENRLLTRGAVHYTYDEEGNLLREEQSDYYLKRYEYAGFNRMEMSDIINYRDNTHVITDYRYDSFGRRIHTAERTKSGMRTIYDGFSFEVVKEAETFLGTRGITSSATGEANLTNYTPHGSGHTRGTRYYFIRDRGQELRTGKSGEALPDRTKGVRTYLYLNGERVAVNNLYNTNHGQYYYGSDILGSVRFITGQGGQELKRIEYDIFGGIYKGNSPYGLETGYTGKPYDAVTGLSDYGFRDYSPAHARFITEDPIRDGENWFAYVGNNPVNWIDPWGLEQETIWKPLTYNELWHTAFSTGMANPRNARSINNQRVGAAFENAIGQIFRKNHNNIDFQNNVRLVGVRPDFVGTSNSVTIINKKLTVTRFMTGNFIEAKTGRVVTADGSGNKQMLAMIDALSQQKDITGKFTASEVATAFLYVATPADTQIAPNVVDYATQKGVGIFQFKAEYNTNNTTEIRLSNGMCLNLQPYVLVINSPTRTGTLQCSH